MPFSFPQEGIISIVHISIVYLLFLLILYLSGLKYLTSLIQHKEIAQLPTPVGPRPLHHFLYLFPTFTDMIHPRKHYSYLI